MIDEKRVTLSGVMSYAVFARGVTFSNNPQNPRFQGLFK